MSKQATDNDLRTPTRRVLLKVYIGSVDAQGGRNGVLGVGVVHGRQHLRHVDISRSACSADPCHLPSDLVGADEPKIKYSSQQITRFPARTT